MLLLAVMLVALTGAWADQDASGTAPAAAYGPPAQTYAAPVPVPAGAAETTALTDGNTYSYSYAEPGFSVQSGFEGYMVPWELLESHGIAAPVAIGLLGKLLPFGPKLGLKLFPKVGVFLLGFLFLLLIGGAFTTAVCAFTPICTISFLGLGGLVSRNSMRSYLTPDRLTQTTAFVLDAIDKYKDIANKVQAKEARRRRR